MRVLRKASLGRWLRRGNKSRDWTQIMGREKSTMNTRLSWMHRSIVVMISSCAGVTGPNM